MLHPGRLEPSVTLPRGSMDVPQASREKLLATFNSGFKLERLARRVRAQRPHLCADAQRPGDVRRLLQMEASNIVDWSYGADRAELGRVRAPEPAADRQQRQAQPEPLNGGEWGATVGNAVLVWRSGIGVDRHGNLIYAAGNDQIGAEPRRHARSAPARCARWSSTSTPTGSASSPTARRARRAREPASRNEPPGDALPRTRRPRLLRGLLALSGAPPRWPSRPDASCSRSGAE